MNYFFKRLLVVTALAVVVMPSTATASPASELAERWKFTSVVAGTIETTDKLPSITMPEVEKFPDGTYRMYYNRSKSPGHEAIVYAESSNGLDWTYKGRVLKGSSDPSHRFYIIGGARVVKVRTGKYRMYFRASTAHPNSVAPYYKTYSALSTDGVHFTVEKGIRINTYPDDPTSNLTLAGHGAFFKNKEKTYTAIISGDPVAPGGGPSDLYIGYSDDGLTWGTFSVLYTDFHDPVSFKYKGNYYLLSKLKRGKIRVATSANGIDWPPVEELTTLKFFKRGEDVSKHIGDVGAVVTPDKQVVIFSNWSQELQAGNLSTAIAAFIQK